MATTIKQVGQYPLPRAAVVRHLADLKIGGQINFGDLCYPQLVTRIGQDAFRVADRPGVYSVAELVRMHTSREGY